VRFTVSFVASLALNVLLLGLLARTGGRDRPVAANESAVAGRIEGAAGATHPAGAEPTDDGEAPAFHWSQLDTSDWFAYRDGLLEAGCPAATVREIIEPGVRRRFVARVRELAAPYVNRFWELALAGDDATFESVKGSVNVLEEEQEKLLKALFAGLPSDDESASASGASGGATLDFLPPSIRERLEELQQAHREELRKARALRDSDEERKARLDELRQRHRTEISSLLTPEEEDQWKLRTSRFAHLRELEGMSLGEADLAEAIRIKERTVGDTNGLERAALVELLGTERAEDFARAQDDEFQALLRMSNRLGATAEQARELWDLEEEARRLADAANQDFERSETERLAELAGLRQRLASSAETVLGGKRGREMWDHSRKDWLGRTFRIAEDDPLASLPP